MKIFNHKKNKGFTLVETLVAIGILSLSILATFTAVQNSLQDSSLSKDRITAFFLAQEVVEFVKNMRDENAISDLSGTPTNWLHGVAESGDPCYFTTTCRIDSSTKILTSCNADPGGVCQNIKQDNVTGLYGYDNGWTSTRFNRVIQFQSISADEVLLTVTISWVEGVTNRTFIVSQLLFNHG